MVEYILIVAAIALPLLALLIIFRDDLKNWFEGEFEDIKDASGSDNVN
jgi:Flp pilus assembly pilin Flp